ncbi:MAG: hypothetical protein ABIH48_00105 [Candidatus Falkowbacteria bacterium]
MKICFLLQRRFAYIGHAMALSFNKKYGLNDFCGYVYMRSSFDWLKSQQDINYTKLLLDEDIHKKYKNEKLDLDYLKYLEQEYGIPNLWPYIELDRVVRYNMLIREYPYNTPQYSHKEMMKIVQVKAKEIIKFFEEEKPDAVVFSVIADISTLLLYNIAKKKNIKIFFIQGVRINTRYTITEQCSALTYVERTFAQIQTGEVVYPEYEQMAKKYLIDFLQKPVPYCHKDSPIARPITRRKQFNFLLPTKITNSLKWIIKTFTNYIFNNHRNDHYVIKPWYHILDRVKRKIRVLIGFNDLYDEVNLTEDFAFFPLQFEPEMSEMLFAPFYNDPLWLIKQTARSLPLHYKLYVKEHPSMFGYRPRRFYKTLKKIPNVKLISPSIESFGLTKNAKIIITTTGTVGWEGLMFKKPVITFGDASYNKLSMVKRCKAIENLPYLIKEQLENFNYNGKELINFITAIYKESVDVDLIKLWDVEGGGKIKENEQRLMPLIDLIASKLNFKSH